MRKLLIIAVILGLGWVAVSRWRCANKRAAAKGTAPRSDSGEEVASDPTPA